MTVRILVADNHAVVRRNVKNLLEQRLPGVTCGEAASSVEVLVEVRRQKWDLVLLDLALAGGDGRTVLEVLARTKPELPVMIMGRRPNSQHADWALKAGAVGYLNKAVTPGDVIRAVGHVLAISQNLTAMFAVENRRN